jgi:FkbM family methyltransferase
MASLVHHLSKLLPAHVIERIRPRWNIYRAKQRLCSELGGQYRFDETLRCHVASRQVEGVALEVPVRSYRELARFVHFGEDRDDLVHRWLNTIDDCETLYDVGSANGLEGFFAAARHGCRVCFIEPFTPSIDALLKGVYLVGRRGGDTSAFEVFAAGCDREPGYRKLYSHHPPSAGVTLNSFDAPDQYCRGGRQNEPIAVTQWVAGVSLDQIHFDLGQPKPTHVKVDVDGFEGRVIEGAKRLVESGHVRSFMIEVNPGREREVATPLKANGYVEIAAFEHYPGRNDCWDRCYARSDLADAVRNRLRNAVSENNRIVFM